MQPEEERTDGRVVGGRTENKLGSTIVATANVGNVGLALDEDFGAAKVTQLEDAGLRVQQQVLRL
jgi:hypothetical protein